MKVAVVTVSDRASRGEYEDHSGPALVEGLSEFQPDLDFVCEVVREVVQDEAAAILAALHRVADCDWIFTTGGTGPAPRDVTPQATAAFIDRELPGLAELLRAESLKETPNAVFSRGIAGMRGTTFVVNAPGSVRAARLCARVFAPLLVHGTKMAHGEGH